LTGAIVTLRADAVLQESSEYTEACRSAIPELEQGTWVMRSIFCTRGLTFAAFEMRLYDNGRKEKSLGYEKLENDLVRFDTVPLRYAHHGRDTCRKGNSHNYAIYIS
jgi:hypothetical protein